MVYTFSGFFGAGGGGRHLGQTSQPLWKKKQSVTPLLSDCMVEEDPGGGGQVCC